MNASSWNARPLRKSPRQTRTANTVEALLEAAVQILIAEGPRGLTTTTVARRSGFAVGTIYQYFANKDELIDAMVRRQLDHVVSLLQMACRDSDANAPNDLAAGLVDAFHAANAHRAREIHAIHAVWDQVMKSGLFCASFARLYDAIVDALATDDTVQPDEMNAIGYALTSTLIGGIRKRFEQNHDDDLLASLQEELARVRIGRVERASPGAARDTPLNDPAKRAAGIEQCAET
jgi:AcrR family transcriptional regulator